MLNCQTRVTVISPTLFVQGLVAILISLSGRSLCQTSQGASSALVSGQQQEVSMGDSLESVTIEHPLHILYVHGIGAQDAGDSYVLRESLCKRLKCISGLKDRPVREYADVEEFDPEGSGPPDLQYMGQRVWKTRGEWKASAPFVDHYILLTREKKVLVDEINWWPLSLALKCRQILEGEAQLAGSNAGYLKRCEKTMDSPKAGDPEDRSFDWLSQSTIAEIKKDGSKAVKLNREVKISLVDWGLSDALLAVGPMQRYFLEGIRQLLVKSVVASGDGKKILEEQEGQPHDAGSEYVVISHSLGSFLIFSALNSERQDALISTTATTAKSAELARVKRGAFRYVLRHTGQAYFFANQVPLLELAVLGSSPSPEARTNYKVNLQHWSKIRTDASERTPQVVAWSDPNDLLSFHLPVIDKVNVVNLTVKNSIRWLWLVENPIGAHDNYARNRGVIHALLTKKAP